MAEDESTSAPLEIAEGQTLEESPASMPCKSCNKAALPQSNFCEDHQYEAQPQRRRKRRIQRLDVILIVILLGLVFGYPRIKGWLKRATGDLDERVQSSLLEEVEQLLGFGGEASKHDNNPKGLAATIRQALTEGGETTPDAVEKMLDRAESGGEQLSLDEIIDRLNAPSGGKTTGLSSAQQARLRSLKSGGAPSAKVASAPAAPAQVAQVAQVALPAPAVMLAHCGNGVIDAGEQCDGSVLGGATCASLGFSGNCDQSDACVHPGLACLSNCMFDYSGCTAETQAAAQRFVDRGNGTATDRLTGLTWELKCVEPQCAERHNVLVAVPWHDAAIDWVNALNTEQYAGHNDWRLPTIEELRTLLAAVPPCPTEPCAMTAWPRNRTAAAGYWSSTTFSVDQHRAWAVSFRDGDVYTAEKSDKLHIRAVRQGS